MELELAGCRDAVLISIGLTPFLSFPSLSLPHLPLYIRFRP